MYIWRGEGQGEGAPSKGETQKAYTMEFKEPRGMIIEGNFGCEYFTANTIYFKAIKVAPGRRFEDDFGYDWIELRGN
jgi:hypothetical protein